MSAEHATSLISCLMRAGGPGYRGVCSCSWQGRIYSPEKRALAENDVQRHLDYTASVRRLTERPA